MIVTDTFYSITAPMELQLRLSDLCAISYYAKALGLNEPIDILISETQEHINRFS